MESELQVKRHLLRRLPTGERRRLVVITGARQTGKTTLARAAWPGIRYVNLDNIEDRSALRDTRTSAWARTVGPAVLDEAQKEPTVFDKVKYAYDAGEIGFSALLGSSRFLLLERVRESLAGRAFVFELWPLMLSEVCTADGGELQAPLLARVAERGVAAACAEEPARLLGPEAAHRQAALAHLRTWGGFPELLRLPDEERNEWLRSYVVTFLERDLADIGRVNDLLPFRKLQSLVFFRSGQLLSFADLARDATLPVATTRRYLEYLTIAGQLIALPPWGTNLTSAVVKSPKLFAADLGLLRSVGGGVGGAAFETLAVSEVHKWVATTGADLRLSFYRTRSGMEVDLLVEGPAGVVGIELKDRARATPSDARNLRTLGAALGDRWLGGMVVTAGEHLDRLVDDATIWEVPLSRLM